MSPQARASIAAKFSLSAKEVQCILWNLSNIDTRMEQKVS